MERLYYEHIRSELPRGRRHCLCRRSPPQLNALKGLNDDQSARIDALTAQVAALQASVVTAAQLAEALSNLSAALIANSSANSNSVMPMEFAVSDPPTQWEVGTILNTINALIQALRRV